MKCYICQCAVCVILRALLQRLRRNCLTRFPWTLTLLMLSFLKVFFFSYFYSNISHNGNSVKIPDSLEKPHEIIAIKGNMGNLQFWLSKSSYQLISRVIQDNLSHTGDGLQTFLNRCVTVYLCFIYAATWHQDTLLTEADTTLENRMTALR